MIKKTQRQTYNDSRDLTNKPYKCVKATLKEIRKIKKQEDTGKKINKNNSDNHIKNTKQMDIFSKIEDTKIVYPTIIDKIKKICGDRIVDIILHTPVNYELWQKVGSLGDIHYNDSICIKVIIREIKKPKVPYYIAQQKHIPTTIKCESDNGYNIDLVFFNIFPKMFDYLTIGKEIYCKGKLTIDKNGKYRITHPFFPKDIENGCYAVYKLNQLQDNDINIDNLKIDKIIPIYSLTEGLKSNQIINIIKKVLQNDNFDFSLLDNCDKYFSNNLPSFKEAITKLHFPEKINDIEFNSKYIKKMSLLELLSFHYTLAKARESRKETKGVKIIGTGKLQQKVIENLPFSLTKDQIKCIKEIEEEQSSDKKMLRLLQGDVGSGKTIVALMCALNCIESGHKVIIMAPTAILAKQHFATIQKFCFGLGISSELLIGETKQKARKDILIRMKLGQIDILVGTHTLFQKNIELPKNIGLFIIDEQHNFGVEQRVNLINKCNNADILMMSATPIPRTMVMGLYGDITISCINQKPSNRLPIDTRIFSIEDKYNSIVEAIKRKVEIGEKIYWICPFVEESEKLDYIDTATRAKELAQVIDKNKIGVIHGKMSQENKDKMMLEFKNGKYNILVATTVIEVGIDVPEATIIIIENAERFGLAQLHQLRGRVGRGDKQSYCFLLYGSNVSDIGKTKLNILKTNENGFQIAEYDLKIRGGGSILDKKQSGFKIMNFVNFSRDRQLIHILNEFDFSKIQQQEIEPIIALFNHKEEAIGEGLCKC